MAWRNRLLPLWRSSSSNNNSNRSRGHPFRCAEHRGRRRVMAPMRLTPTTLNITASLLRMPSSMFSTGIITTTIKIFHHRLHRPNSRPWWPYNIRHPRRRRREWRLRLLPRRRGVHPLPLPPPPRRRRRRRLSPRRSSIITFNRRRRRWPPSACFNSKKTRNCDTHWRYPRPSTRRKSANCSNNHNSSNSSWVIRRYSPRVDLRKARRLLRSQIASRVWPFATAARGHPP